MVVDFQHHCIPVALAKKGGLYSESDTNMLKEGGLPATTMHRWLYDLELQLGDMDEAGVDMSVLSCLWHLPRTSGLCQRLSAGLHRRQYGHRERHEGAARLRRLTIASCLMPNAFLGDSRLQMQSNRQGE